MTRQVSISTVLVSTVLALPGQGVAHWAFPGTITPVVRLIKNVEQFIEEEPNDPQAYFVLARLHSKAFAYGTTANAFRDPKQRLPDFYPTESVRVKRRSLDTHLTEDNCVHLVESIINYRKAAALAPSDARVLLGLGWIQEQAATSGSQLKAFSEVLSRDGSHTAKSTEKDESEFQKLVDDLTSNQVSEEQKDRSFERLQSEVIRAFPFILSVSGHEDAQIRSRFEDLITLYWYEKALEAYRKSFYVALEADLKNPKLTNGPEADTVISKETGHYMLRAYEVLRFLKERDYLPEERKEITRIREGMEKIHVNSFAITPIIFSLDGSRSLEELVDNDRHVPFDLDGDGHASLWPWVQARTGILAWDPERTGRIESGRQLFGSVTWWMFWSDGYQALNALDDNRDGWLSKGEFDGIAVWWDENCNGVSEPGEVVPLQDIGVKRLSVKPMGRKDGVLWNPSGLRLTDGKPVPTYDWIPERLEIDHSRPSQCEYQAGLRFGQVLSE